MGYYFVHKTSEFILTWGIHEYLILSHEIYPVMLQYQGHVLWGKKCPFESIERTRSIKKSILKESLVSWWIIIFSTIFPLYRGVDEKVTNGSENLFSMHHLWFTSPTFQKWYLVSLYNINEVLFSELFPLWTPAFTEYSNCPCRPSEMVLRKQKWPGRTHWSSMCKIAFFWLK